MNFIFDVETSGLPKKKKATSGNLEDFDTARIVSISWILAQGDRIVEQSFFLLKPDNFIIDPEAIKIHGITQERADADGTPIKDMFAELEQSLENVQNIISYNIEFDVNVLKSELYRYSKEDLLTNVDSKHHICCMKKAKEYLNSTKYIKLADAYMQLFGEELADAHNALADTVNCFKCYNKMFPLSRDIFFVKNRKVELTPEQSDIVFAPIDTNIAVLASAGSGKCHAKDTEILMYDGSIKLVQYVQIDDLLMGDDSTKRKVLSLGRGVDEMFEIVMNGYESFVVNSEHILCAKRGLECLEFSVKDYLEFDKEFRDDLMLYRVPVEFPSKNFEFDAYIIGIWLGNGAIDDTIVTLEDEKVFKYFKQELPKYDLSILYLSENNYKIVSSNDKNNVMMDVIKKYGMYENKHIPDVLKINDSHTRECLLDGLIDSKHFNMKSDALAKDVIYLLRSLGIGISAIPALDLTTKFSVISKGRGDYYGFTLDKNHRYLMGNFVVTHNTTTITARIKHLIEQGVAEKSIMLTTFTRDSANDMKRKLFDILGYTPESKIGTIDSISRNATYSKTDIVDVGEHARNYLNYIQAHPSAIKEYKYLFVDEFQDINKLQFEIISEFYKNGTLIFAVGDDHQNIYTFRGSSIEYIMNFRKYFSANSDVFKLTFNFRSTREIINFANESIDKNKNQIPKKMVAGRTDVTPGQKPIVRYFENVSMQNNYVIKKIVELVKSGVREDEIVVLSPINQSLFKIEELLIKKNIKNVYLDGKSDVRTIKKDGHVCLCTIHKSKGLEWDYVFLTNMSDDIIPKMKNQTSIEEHRRLFYVAVTRTKMQLQILYSASSLAPYVTRYVSEIPKEFYVFENFLPIYVSGKSEFDIVYMDTSVTKLIDNLDGDDYIALKKQQIIPMINTKNIEKTKIYESFGYIPIIEKDELYTDFGTFIDAFISREISKVFLLNEKDKYALLTLASVILEKDDYAIYKYYKNNFKDGLKNVKDLSPPKVIRALSTSRPIKQEHVRAVMEIVTKLMTNSQKYKLALEKIPVFNEHLLPDDFVKKMDASLINAYSSKNYKNVIDDIWEISKCHAIVTSYRRKLLFMDVNCTRDMKEYEPLFENISTKLVDFIKENFQVTSDDVKIHEDLSAKEMYGELDLRIGDCIIDYKNSINEDISLSWIVQLLCYKAMHDINNPSKPIKTIAVLNPLKGWYCPFDVSAWDKQEQLVDYLLQKRETLLSSAAAKH